MCACQRSVKCTCLLKIQNSTTIHIHIICSTTAVTLTWHIIHEGIEEGNYEVNEHGTIEENVAPQ
jgi:hypothetical protein